MIQRIQSIYILAALVLEVLQLQLTWISYTLSETQLFLSAFGLDGALVPDVDVSGMWLIFILPLFTVVLTILALGGFKNRKLQMKWCLLTMISSLITLAAAYGVGRNVQKALLNSGAIEVQYHLTMLLPLVVVVLMFMARSAIGRDEELVRSADRIR